MKEVIEMIIDTHAHLNTEDFDHDIESVCARANEQGVTKIIVIGMDSASNLKAIKLQKTYPMIYAAVGIHPGYVNTDQDVLHLETLIKDHDVVAIGECGLDFYWQDDNKELQKHIFHQQILLAIKYNLPLIIHTRKSFDEAYQMLLPYKGQVKGVFHCFSSHLEDARKAIDLGFMIGIDGPITYKNNQILKEIVEQIDLKHILVETDSPYLTPMPYRGKRNEPGHTRLVVEKIAHIKNMSVNEVAWVTTSNAYTLFNIKEDESHA